jgi:hypothetical protein
MPNRYESYISLQRDTEIDRYEKYLAAAVLASEMLQNWDRYFVKPGLQPALTHLTLVPLGYAAMATAATIASPVLAVGVFLGGVGFVGYHAILGTGYLAQTADNIANAAIGGSEQSKIGENLERKLSLFPDPPKNEENLAYNVAGDYAINGLEDLARAYLRHGPGYMLGPSSSTTDALDHMAKSARETFELRLAQIRSKCDEVLDGKCEPTSAKQRGGDVGLDPVLRDEHEAKARLIPAGGRGRPEVGRDKSPKPREAEKPKPGNQRGGEGGGRGGGGGGIRN